MARGAGVVAAVVAAMGLLSTGAANADTFVPLRGGSLTQTLPDGTVVHLWIDNESAEISPSMGATPVHRNAWVSGFAHAQYSGNNVSSTKMVPGYAVGCQVDLSSGATASGNSKVTSSSSSATGGGSLTLGPGQVKQFTLLDFEIPDMYGKDAHKPALLFKGNHGSVRWTDETIGLSGCGGYAQARSFVWAEVNTDHGVANLTVWGTPFSLG